jgi:predicted amidohydrolase
MRDVTGLIVAPGLIDLHTHVYWGGTSLGIDADEFCRRDGVTTCVDTGSAGPGNFAGFRTHVIDRATPRILAFLNISYAGIFGFSRSIMVGEAQDMRLLAPQDCAEIADANRDVIVGIKVRIGRNAGGDSGIAPLEVALQAADEVGMPVMCHIDFPPPNYADTVAMLRPGDILTMRFALFQTRRSPRREEFFRKCWTRAREASCSISVMAWAPSPSRRAARCWRTALCRTRSHRTCTHCRSKGRPSIRRRQCPNSSASA